MTNGNDQTSMADIPRYVEFVADLPRTSTHKVQKAELRSRAEGDMSRLRSRERAGVVVKK